MQTVPPTTIPTSVISLDSIDAGSVQRARTVLAESRTLPYATVNLSQALNEIGRLQAALGWTLDLFDAGTR